MEDTQALERSLDLGEKALGFLKHMRSAAVPRNYELLYRFTEGNDEALKVAIRQAVKAHDRLRDEDAEQIYNEFLSPKRLLATVEEVGENMSQELTDLLKLIQTAATSTDDFGKSLDDIVDDLPGCAKSPARFKSMLGALAKATKKMAVNSHDMKSKLAESRKQIQDLTETLTEVQVESLTDSLTGIGNRKRFDELLPRVMSQTFAQFGDMCLLLCDIDHFKSFNDTYGHQTGDQVLRLVAHTIRSNIKGGDHPARYGGEEFAVILPNTKLAAGKTVAEHIRSAIKARKLIKKSTNESLGNISISVGLATLRDNDCVEMLIQRADACLYAAKRAGRDQVKCEDGVDTKVQTTVAA